MAMIYNGLSSEHVGDSEGNGDEDTENHSFEYRLPCNDLERARDILIIRIGTRI